MFDPNSSLQRTKPKVIINLTIKSPEGEVVPQKDKDLTHWIASSPQYFYIDSLSYSTSSSRTWNPQTPNTFSVVFSSQPEKPRWLSTETPLPHQRSARLGLTLCSWLHPPHQNHRNNHPSLIPPRKWSCLRFSRRRSNLSSLSPPMALYWGFLRMLSLKCRTVMHAFPWLLSLFLKLCLGK